MDKSRLNGFYIITIRGYTPDGLAPMQADAEAAFYDWSNLRSSKYNYTAHGPYASYEAAMNTDIPSWNDHSRILFVKNGVVQQRIARKTGDISDGQIAPKKRGYTASLILGALRALGGTATKRAIVDKMLELGLDTNAYKSDLLTIRANVGVHLKKLPNVNKINRGVYQLAGE